MKLEGKHLLITGGARGIGRAIAEASLAEGARAIVLVDRDESVRQTAEELGKNVMSVLADVTDEGAVQEAVASARGAFGEIDIVVCNAGVAYGGDIFSPDHLWQNVWDVNVMAHVFAARAVMNEWLERGDGYFVSVVSAAGMLTALGAGPYSVTKHAALGLAEWLSATYGSRGIKVSAVCPQGVKTKMLESYEKHVSPVLLTEGAVEVEDVAQAFVEGLDNEQFLITPHPEALDYFRHKAQDWDRWLERMRGLQQKFIDDK